MTNTTENRPETVHQAGLLMEAMKLAKQKEAEEEARDAYLLRLLERRDSIDAEIREHTGGRTEAPAARFRGYDRHELRILLPPGIDAGRVRLQTHPVEGARIDVEATWDGPKIVDRKVHSPKRATSIPVVMRTLPADPADWPA